MLWNLDPGTLSMILSIWRFWVSISLPMSSAMWRRFPMMPPTCSRFSSISFSRASSVTLNTHEGGFKYGGVCGNTPGWTGFSDPPPPPILLGPLRKGVWPQTRRLDTGRILCTAVHILSYCDTHTHTYKHTNTHTYTHTLTHTHTAMPQSFKYDTSWFPRRQWWTGGVCRVGSNHLDMVGTQRFSYNYFK